MRRWKKTSLKCGTKTYSAVKEIKKPSSVGMVPVRAMVSKSLHCWWVCWVLWFALAEGNSFLFLLQVSQRWQLPQLSRNSAKNRVGVQIPIWSQVIRLGRRGGKELKEEIPRKNKEERRLLTNWAKTLNCQAQWEWCQSAGSRKEPWKSSKRKRSWG